MLDFFESDIMEKENGLLYRYIWLKNQTRARCIRSIWNRLGYLAEIEIIFESACTLVKYLPLRVSHPWLRGFAVQ